MHIALTINSIEFDFDSRCGLYIETRSHAFYWPLGGRPVLSRMKKSTNPANA